MVYPKRVQTSSVKFHISSSFKLVLWIILDLDRNVATVDTRGWDLPMTGGENSAEMFPQVNESESNEVPTVSTKWLVI